MIDSIRNDLRQVFNSGNMVTRLLVINIIVFVILILLKAFLQNLGYFQPIFDNLAMPGPLGKLMYKPWTIFTHMFMHIGFWHVVWNMVGLHLFGRIVGDLLGDQRILPIYLWGGLAGAVAFGLYANLAIPGIDSTAHGASAAVCALAAVAGVVAPDYGIRLLLIGDVKLKYIVLAFLVFDLVGTQGGVNSGGHFAHLGGMLMGAIIAYQLRSGNDLTSGLSHFIQNLRSSKKRQPSKPMSRSKMKVEYKAPAFSMRHNAESRNETPEFETELNRILDKIKNQGYNKLSNDEKEFLNKASKRDI
ncbi:MAG: rhomboid family intramembrane serine protease [Saprospiraceae bacterium]|nr:rhomboid family intramembrane serine protease [Saprospiraceae bacterium]MBK8632180.1 rhomboid family intramembrane serine protease [Saprospiraceae bacterium]